MAAKVYPSSKIKKCHEDRISELPDFILGHILSSFSTRDIVLTSILSKRWRSVWTSAPSIEIQDYWVESKKLGFPDVELRFTNFVDRVLRLNEFSCLKRISLTCRKTHKLSRVSEWISSMARLDVEELDLNFLAGQCFELPQSIFTCKKLVTLNLRKGVILNVPSSSSSSVSLPRLKVLRLVEVTDLDHDSVSNLLIGCPILEELYIARGHYDNLGNKTLYVQSSTLKSLTFYSGGDWQPSYYLSRMVIDASNLEQLDLKIGVMEKIEVINSLSSLVRVKLDLEFRCSRWEIHRIPVVELLRNVSNTKHLYLSYKTLESLDGHYDNMTMLKNLTHLEVKIPSLLHCPFLSCVLENAPNLISFVLTMKQICLSNIVRKQQFHIRDCKMSYLENIELKGFVGYVNPEMEMVRYFLKNAPILKKMSIRFQPLTPVGKAYFCRKLTKIPAACEIEVTEI